MIPVKIMAGDDATRAQGLRASIALWLGDLSLSELELVDVEVMKIRRRRKGGAR